MAYIGGQHLYPSAAALAKKKTPKATPIDWIHATQTGSGTLDPRITDWAHGGSPTPAAGGGHNPYAQLIEDMLNQTRADIRGDSLADAASRDAAIRRLLISYGASPDLAGLGISGEASGVLGHVLDPKTKQLIEQNTAEGTSVSARMEAANAKALGAIPANRAARGGLHSGGTGYDLGQQAMAHKQTTFDVLNEMLGNVEGAVGSYAANERARQRALAQAEQDAAWRSATLWEDDPVASGPTGPDYGDPGSNGPLGGVPTGSLGMLNKATWLSMHPGGNYANYVKAYKARNQPIYMGGAYRY